MNLAEQLESKKNDKAREFATTFLKEIKPQLIKSAESGYSSYMYVIDTNIEKEKHSLQLYSNPVFVTYLNENLGGVEVQYKKDFKESIFLKGYGAYKYYLTFSWEKKKIIDFKEGVHTNAFFLFKEN